MVMGRGPRRAWVLAIVALVLALFLAARAGGFLVINAPQPSDAILVLAGETNRRPELALRLLAEGYGRKIVLDVPARNKIYEFTQQQLAEKYIQDLSQGALISVCPIQGLSTKDEAKDAEKCLSQQSAKSVLIVTSDFHTRRSLSVFRRSLPVHEYSIAAAHDEDQFGVRWWVHRQWAKTFVDEWMRFLWWKVIDQWI